MFNYRQHLQCQSVELCVKVDGLGLLCFTSTEQQQHCCLFCLALFTVTVHENTRVLDLSKWIRSLSENRRWTKINCVKSPIRIFWKQHRFGLSGLVLWVTSQQSIWCSCILQRICLKCWASQFIKVVTYSSLTRRLWRIYTRVGKTFSLKLQNPREKKVFGRKLPIKPRNNFLGRGWNTQISYNDILTTSHFFRHIICFTSVGSILHQIISWMDFR